MHIRDKRPHPSKVKDLLAGQLHQSCTRAAPNECCNIIKSLPCASLTVACRHRSFFYAFTGIFYVFLRSFFMILSISILFLMRVSYKICHLICSGLSHESHRRDVEQIYLRCSQGSLEWLYPTGAIIINLRPNTEPSSGHTAGLHVCIKPHTHSQVEHDTRILPFSVSDGWSSYMCPPGPSVFRVLMCTWSITEI